MKYTVEFQIDEKMFKNIINHKKDKRIAEILGARAVKNIRIQYYAFQKRLAEAQECFDKKLKIQKNEINYHGHIFK
jgi:hypothetical protein